MSARRRGRRAQKASGFRLRHPLFLGLSLALAAAVIIAVVVASLDGGGGRSGPGPSTYPYPVQMFEDETPARETGKRHLQPGEVFDDYNSNPPTNGRHSGNVAPWGVSDTPLPRQVTVHNMEHAGVVVWYNCNGGPQPLDSTGCQTLREELAAVVDDFVSRGRFVLMTPYSDVPNRIALTAWQYLDSFDEFDEARVRAYIEAFECRFDPEGFC